MKHFGLAGLCCSVCTIVLKEVSSISVDIRPGESQESLMRRFRKSVAEARILPIVRQKRWFTSKSEVRRINKQKAIRKARRNAARSFR
jgi:small subunit ribosomal protein S21